MYRLLALITVVLFSALNSVGQDKPRLVVGIVVDQMRMDYIYRYQSRFGNDGFRRLMAEGYTFHNGHFNYVPTSTAPGHASVYTGSTPAVHGVVGNSWFDQKANETVYCAYDGSYASVGADNDNGKMSPHQLLTTTFTDQLRLADRESRVIGISIKDRGAVFPAGHLGKAYWYDASSGDFISSTYYHQEELPDWVEQFNRRNLSSKYRKEVWRPLEPIKSYTASGPDESPYEGGLLGKQTFPYDLSAAEGEAYGIIPSTPFGNDILAELAMAAIDDADLGRDEHTDVLAVSFSSTDYIGHNFGPRSVEVEDTYLRLDRNIAAILEKLDEEVGKGNYTVFLTADHAVADVPKYMMDNHMPAGYFRTNLPGEVNNYLTTWLGPGEWVRNISNYQVFLDREKISETSVSLHDVREALAEFLRSYEGIAASWTANDLISGGYNESGIKGMYIRGYHQERGGDVAFALKPGWLASGNDHGTSHGSGYNYDTHVPIIFFGKGVRQGQSREYRTIADIAPTVSALLYITMPDGATGNILTELIGQ